MVTVFSSSLKEGPVGKPFKLQSDFDRFLNTQNINGIIIQTSNQSLLDYVSEQSPKVPNVGIAAVGSFFERYNVSYP